MEVLKGDGYVLMPITEDSGFVSRANGAFEEVHGKDYQELFAGTALAEKVNDVAIKLKAESSDEKKKIINVQRPAPVQTEIGRASCRERVYVLV